MKKLCLIPVLVVVWICGCSLALTGDVGGWIVEHVQRAEDWLANWFEELMEDSGL